MNLTPGKVGLVLVYLFQILSHFQWSIRQSAEVENLVTRFSFLRFTYKNKCFKIDDISGTSNGIFKHKRRRFKKEENKEF